MHDYIHIYRTEKFGKVTFFSFYGTLPNKLSVYWIVLFVFMTS